MSNNIPECFTSYDIWKIYKSRYEQYPTTQNYTGVSTIDKARFLRNHMELAIRSVLDNTLNKINQLRSLFEAPTIPFTVCRKNKRGTVVEFTFSREGISILVNGKVFWIDINPETDACSPIEWEDVTFEDFALVLASINRDSDISVIHDFLKAITYNQVSTAKYEDDSEDQEDRSVFDLVSVDLISGKASFNMDAILNAFGYNKFNFS